MGGGSYSYSDRTTRAKSSGYDTKSARELFSHSVNDAMSPRGALLRESRDSAEHPETLSMILSLDVTGSMGSIPHHMIKDGLPTLMDSIIQHGIEHPQLLFLAIGDHECDRNPLQVGQFESSDELLDKWLTSVYLEGGGGGNAGESYLLSWYYAAKHTSIDCFDKRGKKGYLFTVGDEPTLRDIPGNILKELMGEGQFNKNYTAAELLDMAREKYHVYHFHILQGSAGNRQETKDGWKQLMGDSLIILDDYTTMPKRMAEIIVENERSSDGNVYVAPKISTTKVDDTEEQQIIL